MSAGRAREWIGGNTPISEEAPLADFMAHAFPKWHWERVQGAIEQVLRERQRATVDSTQYGLVTYNIPPGQPDGDD